MTTTVLHELHTEKDLDHITVLIIDTCTYMYKLITPPWVGDSSSVQSVWFQPHLVYKHCFVVLSPAKQNSTTTIASYNMYVHTLLFTISNHLTIIFLIICMTSYMLIFLLHENFFRLRICINVSYHSISDNVQCSFVIHAHLYK